MPGAQRTRIITVGEDASVTQLELFFDLVIVFAFTMVTDLAAHETTAVNLLRALVILMLLWWNWIGYSWLGNVVKADEGITRIAMFIAMGAVFLIALTIPEAFHDLPGGWYGPLVFVIAYLVARAVHLWVFWLASAGDAKLRGQVVRWASGSLTIGGALLIFGALSSGGAQVALWFAALAAEMLWTGFSGNDWVLNSAKHFAERYGLIIIIALGESIVSIGVGVAGLPISWPIALGSILGLAISGLLWWAYFDVAALMVEHELEHAKGERRIQIARGCYTYWHFPMIAGIVALSLGLKKVLSYVGGAQGHSLQDKLYGIPLYALYGGVVAYLLALVGFRYYATHKWLIPRVVASVALLALIPLATALPALAALGLLCAVLTAMIGWETLRYAQKRDQIRHGGTAPV
ncbi:low temperature requirement protein A [Nocardia sp. NBC_01503]|uniref:low temperature requirement protein A n=1 Tax=Nocardia sp. NBC_01503 TaxID=2975997 RepID=UPI002E7C0D36|nr:low temperature requirement protein A [Nocardia sp. NBC_01503]WTL34503.1 low temperature requirement protein A [Nocardia sp. NBC_01503]